MAERRFDPDAPGSGAGIYGLPFALDESEVALLPVPWAATVSYGTGAAEGPLAIFEASQQVDLYDRETGRPFERGIHMLPIPGSVRASGEEARALVEKVLARTEGLGASAPVDRDHPCAREFAWIDEIGLALNRWVAAETARLHAAGKLVGLIGGDHSSPFGAIESAAATHGEIGVLQIDAHADLRDAYMGFTWSHASIFHNVLERIPGVSRLVQVGIRDLGQAEAARIEDDPRIRTFFDPDLAARQLRGEPWSEIVDEIVAALPPKVYISFDIDGLDPSLCPHTGTPVPGGLGFSQTTVLLAAIAGSGKKIVGFDLCEVAPGGGTSWDANVGARILYKLIGFALATR